MHFGLVTAVALPPPRNRLLDLPPPEKRLVSLSIKCREYETRCRDSLYRFDADDVGAHPDDSDGIAHRRAQRDGAQARSTGVVGFSDACRWM